MNEKRKMKVKVQTFFISLSIFAVVFIYCAMGHYDKMGIRSDEDSAQYYMRDGEIYVQNDAYIINVNNENLKYRVTDAYIDVLGYLVIMEKDKLHLIDEENHVFRDSKGNMYVALEYAYWISSDIQC